MEQFKEFRSMARPCAQSMAEFERYENFCHDLGRKWRMRILCTLAYGCELRYCELKSALSPITHKILSEELGELAQLGFVTRRECGGVPMKVVYSLSERGRELLFRFVSMAEWVDCQGA